MRVVNTFNEVLKIYNDDQNFDCNSKACFSVSIVVKQFYLNSFLFSLFQLYGVIAKLSTKLSNLFL